MLAKFIVFNLRGLVLALLLLNSKEILREVKQNAPAVIGELDQHSKEIAVSLELDDLQEEADKLVGSFLLKELPATKAGLKQPPLSSTTVLASLSAYFSDDQSLPRRVILHLFQ